MISVQNISKKFGSIQAVENISFDIQPGEIVGFLGPNGAGKSTTMRMIAGFVFPTQGQIKIDDIDMTIDPVRAKQKIGYLPESAALYMDMIVIDFLIFMGSVRGLKKSYLQSRLKAVIEQCQLKPVLNRQIGDLSKGYRQRIGLAQALLHDPQILILDEPTVGLDPNQIAEIRALIREIGKTKTILLSTHILPEVSAVCDRVIIISNGRIVVQGTPESLMVTGEDQCSYRVGLRGELSDVNAKIKGLPGFLSASTVQSQGDRHQIIVHCKGNSDMSEAIFDLAVTNKWKLSALTRETRSLETVFKNLTGANSSQENV